MLVALRVGRVLQLVNAPQLLQVLVQSLDVLRPAYRTSGSDRGYVTEGGLQRNDRLKGWLRQERLDSMGMQGYLAHKKTPTP